MKNTPFKFNLTIRENICQTDKTITNLLNFKRRGGIDMGTKIKNEEIGMRIMRLRLDRGYSRDCLAELAGISAKFLFEIEKQQKGFSATTLFNLAEALEVSTDYIMTGHGSTKFDDDIAAELGRFEPCVLEKVQKLLRLAYEIAHVK